MANITQLNFIKKTLKEHGHITRNQCLNKYISRLSARIHDLRSSGWNIDGKYIKTANGGKDYKYTLIKAGE